MFHALATQLHTAARTWFGSDASATPVPLLVWWKATRGATTFTVEITAVETPLAADREGTAQGLFERPNETRAFNLTKSALPFDPATGVEFLAGCATASTDAAVKRYRILKAQTHEQAAHWHVEAVFVKNENA